jgi:hypothetical protein
MGWGLRPLPDCFPPGKETRYPLNTRLGGPGRLAEGKNRLLLSGLELRTAQSLVLWLPYVILAPQLENKLVLYLIQECKWAIEGITDPNVHFVTWRRKYSRQLTGNWTPTVTNWRNEQHDDYRRLLIPPPPPLFKVYRSDLCPEGIKFSESQASNDGI